MQNKHRGDERQTRDCGVRRHRRAPRGPVAEAPLGPCHTVMRVEPVALSALQPGVVVMARFPYEEGDGRYKPRPAVVESVRGGMVVLRKCTSAESRFRQVGNVELRDLQCAGLYKATGVQIRRAEVERTDVILVLGRLSERDAARVFGRRGSAEMALAVAA